MRPLVTFPFPVHTLIEGSAVSDPRQSVGRHLQFQHPVGFLETQLGGDSLRDVVMSNDHERAARCLESGHPNAEPSLLGRRMTGILQVKLVPFFRRSLP